MTHALIKEALLHCAGVGPVRLQQLHENGVRTWGDVVAKADLLPRTIREPVLNESRRCLAALQADDIGYFVESLHAKDKWRILSEYRSRTSYFDIETVGLECDARISVIVVWHRGHLHQFVEHENLDDFLHLLDDVELLASFNGSSFDVPRVLDAFHIPELPCPHLDLRWLCYHHGFHGGLKEITHRLGIRRPADLADADGGMAVHLWQKWEHFEDRSAKELLLRYCCADVILLAILAERLDSEAAPQQRMHDGHGSTSHALWRHLPTPTPGANEAGKEGAAHNSKAVQADFGAGAPSKLRGRRSRFTM